MDTMTGDRRAVLRVIESYAEYRAGTPGAPAEVVVDETRGHYLLLHVGWEGLRRVYSNLIHVDVRDGKVWIQNDWTEDGIAEELVDAGIPRDRIVLAFKHPEVRPLTAYATA